MMWPILKLANYRMSQRSSTRPQSQGSAEITPLWTLDLKSLVRHTRLEVARWLSLVETMLRHSITHRWALDITMAVMSLRKLYQRSLRKAFLTRKSSTGSKRLPVSLTQPWHRSCRVKSARISVSKRAKMSRVRVRVIDPMHKSSVKRSRMLRSARWLPKSLILRRTYRAWTNLIRELILSRPWKAARSTSKRIQALQTWVAFLRIAF